LVIPPVNDVDIYTQDVGFIVIAEGDRLVGFNLLAGGGMGRSHGNAQTFPRLADTIGFIEPKDLVTMAKGVLTIHRDFGDRTNRKHARLKYVLEERGSDWFREELERRTGVKIQPARPVRFTTTGDQLGWHQQLDGNHFLVFSLRTVELGTAGLPAQERVTCSGAAGATRGAPHTVAECSAGEHQARPQIGG
jgi:sulfite reductase (NADPH) hemoprotein beta-component